MKPKVYAIAPGTTQQTLQLPPCRVLEVIPGGTVSITVQLGDGNDSFTLGNGTAYASPPTGDVIDAMVLRFTGASATTATIIQWV